MKIQIRVGKFSYLRYSDLFWAEHWKDNGECCYITRTGRQAYLGDQSTLSPLHRPIKQTIYFVSRRECIRVIKKFFPHAKIIEG